MQIEVVAVTRDSVPVKIWIDRHPDSCPCCHKGIEVMPKFAYCSTNTSEQEFPDAQIVYRCPLQACQKVFVSTFVPVVSRRTATQFCFGFSEPSYPETPQHAEELTRLSPGYVEIYNQALAAETLKLDQLAGMGYRKALEFLVKDYLCYLIPDKSEAIKGTMLGKCIENYVNDTNVKETARRAAWLGNDETHYVRKWEDKDRKDLKRMLGITAHWIEAALLTEQVLMEMPDGK